MTDLIRNSGAFGPPILLCSLALCVYGAYVLFASRSRGSYWRLLVLSAIPLGLGVAGSALGHERAELVTRGASPRDVAAWRERANAPMVLGGGAFLAFGLVAGFGIVFQREGGESLL